MVTREEIKQHIWGQETFVDFEHGLNFCIRRIRAVLEDDADHPAYIETVPRRGYRFIAPVEVVQAGASPVQTGSTGIEAPSAFRATRAARRALAVVTFVLLLALGLGAAQLLRRFSVPKGVVSIHSIAVLPLENLTGDPAQDYFADGMTDALTTNLAKMGALRVISRTSAMYYKASKKSLPEISRELNVDAVVEGSVMRSGERVRITAQLIHGATDRHLWADSYDGDLHDVLTLQSEVARDIAHEVRIKLTDQEQASLASAGPINPRAHEAYLRGRYFWNRRTGDGFIKAIEYFQQAIDNDPNYALAYAGLSDCYVGLGEFGIVPPKEAFSKARAAAAKALAIDETLAEAHVPLAAVKEYDWDWPGAEKEFQRAIELNPNYATAHQWYAEYLTNMGRTQEAVAEIGRARDLDPLSLVINTISGWPFHYARQYDRAIEQYRKALEMDPNFATGHVVLGRAYVQEARYDEAVAELQKAVDLSAGNPLEIAFLGHAYALAGKRREAVQVLGRLQELSKKRYVSPDAVALIFVGLGQKNQALAWLEKAYADHSRLLVTLKVDPAFDSLRSDPRFQDLLRRLGLST